MVSLTQADVVVNWRQSLTDPQETVTMAESGHPAGRLTDLKHQSICVARMHIVPGHNQEVK